MQLVSSIQNMFISSRRVEVKESMDHCWFCERPLKLHVVPGKDGKGWALGHCCPEHGLFWRYVDDFESFEAAVAALPFFE